MFTGDSKRAVGSPGTSKSPLAAAVRPHKAVGIGSLSPHSSPSTSAKPSGKPPF